MNIDQIIVYRGGYVTFTTLFIGVFHKFLADKLVYRMQDKGVNCERIYT